MWSEAVSRKCPRFYDLEPFLGRAARIQPAGVHRTGDAADAALDFLRAGAIFDEDEEESSEEEGVEGGARRGAGGARGGARGGSGAGMGPGSGAGSGAGGGAEAGAGAIAGAAPRARGAAAEEDDAESDEGDHSFNSLMNRDRLRESRSPTSQTAGASSSAAARPARGGTPSIGPSSRRPLNVKPQGTGSRPRAKTVAETMQSNAQDKIAFKQRALDSQREIERDRREADEKVERERREADEKVERERREQQREKDERDYQLARERLELDREGSKAEERKTWMSNSKDLAVAGWSLADIIELLGPRP